MILSILKRKFCRRAANYLCMPLPRVIQFPVRASYFSSDLAKSKYIISRPSIVEIESQKYRINSNNFTAYEKNNINMTIKIELQYSQSLNKIISWCIKMCKNMLKLQHVHFPGEINKPIFSRIKFHKISRTPVTCTIYCVSDYKGK